MHQAMMLTYIFLSFLFTLDTVAFKLQFTVMQQQKHKRYIIQIFKHFLFDIFYLCTWLTFGVKSIIFESNQCTIMFLPWFLHLCWPRPHRCQRHASRWRSALDRVKRGIAHCRRCPWWWSWGSRCPSCPRQGRQLPAPAGQTGLGPGRLPPRSGYLEVT